MSSVSGGDALEWVAVLSPHIADVRRTRELRVRIPETWAVALDEAASTQGISVCALIRLVIGPFVRERLA